MQALSTIRFRARRWSAIGSFGLTVLTWLWLPVAFAAREGAWWNTIYLLVASFAVSTLLALVGSRSTLGHLPLIAALFSLGFTCVFAI